jgi:hypothetical protein
VRIFRRRTLLRPLDEQECYLRLHGDRRGEVAVVASPRPAPPPSAPALDGPTEPSPALHLVIAYPRSGARLTGEQLRRDLLRRMRARAGEAA